MKVVIDLFLQFSNNETLSNLLRGATCLRFLILLLLVFCLLLMAFHVPAVQNHLIQSQLQQLENAYEVKVHLQGHRWNMGSGLRLSGIRAYAGNREFLNCEEAQVSGGLSLRWPFFRLQEIHLIRPVLRLEKGNDRKWRLPTIASGEHRAKSSSSFREEDLPSVFPLRLKIVSGQIIAEQAGKEILSVKDVTGVIVVRMNPGIKGSELMMDFVSGGPFTR
jgi:hypothetical protein